MSDINQFNITQKVKDSFETEPDSRFEKILHSVIDHLHDCTRELNVTHEEWMGVLNFLYDCGKISTPERHEFILLSDVLGFSALVDMINTRGGATEGSNLGPFYLDNAPEKKLGAHLADDRDGVTVLVHGKVTDSLHKPLPGAIVDTWQADASGTYPIQEQEQGQDKMDLRGKFTTDEHGRYYYTTVLPKPYTVPYDGPVGQLLRAGNRHAWRAAHLHYIVRAEGMHDITTEVFFENTEYIDNDAVFGVRKSLIAKLEPVKKLDELDIETEKKPDAMFKFDFVLAPESKKR
ncbi:dioxygenase [Citreimonas sp.]|uniref:dioxygenase family protein n=1 Tax=Citreimonas sp. TaxID=3036715 RepID=UPI0035C855C7